MSTEKNNRPSNMSAEDHAALNAAGAAYNNATNDAERAAAHKAAEDIRAKYNYSGGSDGSQNISAGNTITSSGSGTKTSSSGSYTPAGKGSDYYMNAAEMSDSDKAALKAAGDAWNAANAKGDQAAMDAAHAQAEAIRNKYGYSGGGDGSEYIALLPQKVPIQQIPQYTAQVPDFTGLLDSWLETAKKQQELGIDYATQKGVNDLQRAEEDAQEQFQTQQNQVDENEAKALDNQALYAEARGDRGGIGHAQYGQIQATAMQNRRAINTARTKLSTDTARAIADLRAQGEFKKADALLQLTQTYLGQLIDLQKWGAEYALSVEQFNAQLQQWQAEFELESQKFTAGLEQWDKEFNYAVSQDERNALAKSGAAALSVGVRPSAAQQAAMGYTDAQVDAELAAYKLKLAGSVKSSGGSGNGGKPKDTPKASVWASVVEWVNKYGGDDPEKAAEEYVKAHHEELGYKTQGKALSAWYVYQAEAAVEEAAAAKNDYPAVLNELSKLEDSNFADAVKINKIIDLIEKANKAGRITDEQAEKLLAQYGL